MSNVIHGNFRQEMDEEPNTPEFATLGELCLLGMVGTARLEQDRDGHTEAFAFFLLDGEVHLYQRAYGFDEKWGWVCAIEGEAMGGTVSHDQIMYRTRELAINQAKYILEHSGKSWTVIEGEIDWPEVD